jgi:hypothetical protein
MIAAGPKRENVDLMIFTSPIDPKKLFKYSVSKP